MAYMELEHTLFMALNKDTMRSITRSSALMPRGAGALRQGRRQSFARWKRASCCRALPPIRTSISVAAAYAQRCWEGRHDHHALSDSRPPPSRRSWTGIETRIASSSRSAGCSAMPEPANHDHSVCDRRAWAFANEPRWQHPGEVLFAAFTGKAALVMTRKGTPASTIHSLIYRVSEATPEEIARVEKEAADLRASIGTLPPAEQLFARSGSSASSFASSDIHKPRFVLNEQSLVREAKLLVLDEVSMVGAEMARRPSRLRQADPGARRSRPTAADQGRRRLHRCASPT